MPDIFDEPPIWGPPEPRWFAVPQPPPPNVHIDDQVLQHLIRQLKEGRFATLQGPPNPAPPPSWRQRMTKFSEDALIREEIRSLFAVNRWCRKHLGGPALPDADVEKSVRQCYDAHEEQIKRWRGWRYIGEPTMMDDKDGAIEMLKAIRAEIKGTDLWKACSNKAKAVGVLIDLDSVGLAENEEGYFVNLLLQKNVPDQLGRKSHTRKEGLSCCVLDMELISYSLRPLLYQHASGVEKQRVMVRPGERISAAILDHAKKHYSDLIPEYIPVLERLLQLCGERVWSMQKYPMVGVVSVAPSNFMMIGNTGYDGESCFRTRRGANQSNKKRLALALRDSFSLWFFRNKKNPHAKMRKNRYGMPGSVYNVARGWGFSLLPHGICASNFYGLLRSELRPVYTDLLTKAFDFEVDKEVTGASMGQRDWYGAVCHILNPIIYFNNDADFLIKSGGQPSQFPAQLQKRIITDHIN